jgi:hypothetical protein
MMMKKYGSLVVMLMITQGTVLSMLHTKKIMKSASRLQLQKRALVERGTGLKDIEDMKKLLSDVKSKVAKYDQLSQIRQEPLLDANDKWYIRKAYIDSIYKIARIEAMGKIYAMPNLDMYQRRELLDKVQYVVKE